MHVLSLPVTGEPGHRPSQQASQQVAGESPQALGAGRVGRWHSPASAHETYVFYDLGAVYGLQWMQGNWISSVLLAK